MENTALDTETFTFVFKEECEMPKENRWMNAKLLNLENCQLRILTEALLLGLAVNRTESK